MKTSDKKLKKIICFCILICIFLMLSGCYSSSKETNAVNSKPAAIEDDTSGLFDGVVEPSSDTWCENLG